MRQAERMHSIPFSGIRTVFEEVTRREKRGEKIIHLEIGRPDFDTPKRIKDKAHWALDAGQVHYTSNYGLPELRNAVARKLREDNGVDYDPGEEVIVTVGANEAVLMAMMALLNPGDEVLVPDPCWPHYFYCARMAGAVPVSVPLRREDRFQPDPDAFRERVTPSTRMLVITSPHNPTGAVFGEEALQGLAGLARERDLFVISDEIYEKMVYGAAVHRSMAALPGMRERTILINGLSKIYAMTGWRLGYVAAPSDISGALVRIHQYTTVCAATFAQWGGVEALEGPQGEAAAMVAEFDRRRKMVCERLSAMRGIELVVPEGAFYVLPHIGGLGKTPEELARYLLDEARVAVVPGTVLGEHGDGFIRISYANSYENLERAMENMKRALMKL